MLIDDGFIESETIIYMAMTSAIQEALWLEQLANEVHYQIKNINIFCDNQGAIKLNLMNGKFQIFNVDSVSESY